jgi:hypothetical protein
MERPTDSYKETHNLALAEADKLFGGQVSNLQVFDFGQFLKSTAQAKETAEINVPGLKPMFPVDGLNQVAELIASIVKNADISKDKIVEVVAETTAPLRPIRELLEEIPASGTPTAPIPRRENPPPIISLNQKEVKISNFCSALVLFRCF